MMLLDVILTFAASCFFAVIFNAPKKDIFFCGITGGIGWFFYLLINNAMGGVILSTFVAAVSLSACSRFISHIRRVPATVYLFPGIIPLVPGSGIYYTMTYLLDNDMAMSFNKGLETLKIAGAISLGIIVIFSLPYSIFNLNKIRPKNKS